MKNKFVLLTSFLLLAFPYNVYAAIPDLTIAKSHSGNFTQGQTGATYMITVTNSGTGPTSGIVTVTDTVPSGLTATAISGLGWSCTQQAGSCTRSDALPAAGSYPALTLTVNVANNAPASVTNTATVSGGGELNTANNTANDPTTITPSVIYVSKNDSSCNGHDPCRTNIQNGIALLSGPSIIEITEESYDGDIVLDVDEEIMLEGGWDTNFESCSSYTTIKGSITITNGTMIFEYIILK